MLRELNCHPPWEHAGQPISATHGRQVSTGVLQRPCTGCCSSPVSGRSWSRPTWLSPRLKKPEKISGRATHLKRGEKFVFLPNGYDPGEFEGLSSARKYKLPLRLIHAGNLTLERDITPLLEAVARVNRDGVLCRLELAGQVSSRTLEKITELGLENAVSVSGYLPRPELLSRLGGAHAGVVVEAFRPGAELVVPGKLYDYFGAGLPALLLGPEGAASSLIEKTGGGIAATEPDPMRLENLVRQMIEYVRRGGPALRPADPVRLEEFHRPRIVERLAGLLEQ